MYGRICLITADKLQKKDVKKGQESDEIFFCSSLIRFRSTLLCMSWFFSLSLSAFIMDLFSNTFVSIFLSVFLSLFRSSFWSK